MKRNPHDIDKAFISDYDYFLAKFDKTHHQSASQIKEREKYERISRLRDHAQSSKEGVEIWEEF
ncbi:MAG: hypothetical protein NTW08_07360 [Gammaproteobacteria bacterium]|nr:hypothetical protein [Gammaproteobacteria bacterium]